MLAFRNILNIFYNRIIDFYAVCIVTYMCFYISVEDVSLMIKEELHRKTRENEEEDSESETESETESEEEDSETETEKIKEI